MVKTLGAHVAIACWDRVPLTFDCPGIAYRLRKKSYISVLDQCKMSAGCVDSNSNS